MGKLDIDYQVLHDAFFKFQTKPSLSVMGDLYYEGKEYEARVRRRQALQNLLVLWAGMLCEKRRGRQMESSVQSDH